MRKPEPCWTDVREVDGATVAVDHYVGKMRADRGAAWAEKTGHTYEYKLNANGCYGRYARTDCTVTRPATAAEIEERDRERRLTDQERAEQEARYAARVATYRARFTPEQLAWMDTNEVTCFGMKVYPRRRQYPSPEEVDILAELRDTDAEGWLEYADWLARHGARSLPQKIRCHVEEVEALLPEEVQP